MKIWKSKWLSIIIIPLILGIVILLYPPVFYLNDDVTMRSILNGAYTGNPDGHAVYMQYPLTGVLALLYRMAGFVPWFELFLTLCIAVCMILVAKKFPWPMIGCLIAIALYVPFCIYMHYTLVAALAAATAVFLLMTGDKGWWSLGLILVAYMIRSQIGLLCLPFVACALVWQVITLPKEKQKRGVTDRIKLCVGILIGILLCLGINSLCYRTEEWKNYLAYNDSRTLLYDYTDFLSTDYYAENYASYGMTEEDYKVFSSYNLMLDGSISEKKMQNVAEAVSQGMQQNISFLQQFKNVIYKYYIQVRYSDAPFNFIWLVLYIVVIVGFVLGKRWKFLTILGILGVGRSCIWMYLIWKGRFPERVSLSLYMMEIMLLMGMVLTFAKDMDFLKQKRNKVIALLLALGFLVACGYNWQKVYEKVKQRSEIQSGWSTLKWYCEENPEPLYLVDVFSAVEYADNQYAEDAENIKLMGGWMSASPLTKEVFSKRGVADAAEALYYCEDVRLIVACDRETLWLEEYMQNRFGDCELIKVGEINWRGGKGFAEYMVQVATN